jgi:hypothetical protein
LEEHRLGGGTCPPMPRYPGTKHSGKQMMSALSADACAIACSARTTDSSGVAGRGKLASAIRMVLIACVSIRGAPCVYASGFRFSVKVT